MAKFGSNWFSGFREEDIFLKLADGRWGAPDGGSGSLGLLVRCAGGGSRRVSGKWYHPHRTEVDGKSQTFAVLSRVRSWLL